jgi:hypothetical protein
MKHDCSRHLLPAFGFRGCYFCLKARHREGGRLTQAELAFIGYLERRSNGNGWHPVDITAEIGSGSCQDMRGVRWLLQVGSERHEVTA